MATATRQAGERSMRHVGGTLSITDERGRRERYAIQAFRDDDSVLLGCRLVDRSAGRTLDVELATERCTCQEPGRWGCGCLHVAAVKKLAELGRV